MNRKTTNFTLTRTSRTETVFTEAIILMLMACMRHATATNTKYDRTPELGPKGTALIMAVKETYKLCYDDAVENVHSMVNNFEVHHFAPAVSDAEKATARHVLRTLYSHGPLSSMVCDDIIDMIDHFE